MEPWQESTASVALAMRVGNNLPKLMRSDAHGNALFIVSLNADFLDLQPVVKKGEHVINDLGNIGIVRAAGGADEAKGEPG